MTDEQFEQITEALQTITKLLKDVEHNTSGSYYVDDSVSKTNKLLEELINITKR